jgi:hypothetical protein
VLLDTSPRDELERLYRDQWDRMWRAVFAFAGDREIASDAVAEAFAQALRRGGAIRSLDRWLGRPPRPMGPPPRRSQRAVAILVALLVAAGGIFAVTRAFDRDTRQPAARVGQSPTKTPEQTPTETPSPSSTPPGGVFGAMYKAIRASSPPGWTFSFTYDRLDGDWVIDGNVDDGSGPGRLNVYVTTRPGILEIDPCADHEFTMGAECHTDYLVNNDLLVMRNLLVDPGGTKTIEAVLIHPDRSGVGGEVGNFLAPVLPDGKVSQSQLPRSQVSRDQPLYTVEQLAELVQAVDRAVQNCLRPNC